jgi:hypothetical protein
MEPKKIIRKVFTTPDWKEAARPRVSSASNHFLIDTNREMVFCRHCRDLCDAIELADFTMYWCSDKLCENIFEAEVIGGRLQAADEALDARLFAPAEIPWQILAFSSTRDALRDYLGKCAPAPPPPGPRTP